MILLDQFTVDRAIKSWHDAITSDSYIRVLIKLSLVEIRDAPAMFTLDGVVSDSYNLKSVKHLFGG